MPKAKRSLIPIIKTPSGICPFCNVPLVPLNRPDDTLPDRYCPTEKVNANGRTTYCPYFFFLRCLPKKDGSRPSYNLIEFFVDGQRVWTFKKAGLHMGCIGYYDDPDHWDVLSIPLAEIDFTDMMRTADKVKGYRKALMHQTNPKCCRAYGRKDGED